MREREPTVLIYLITSPNSHLSRLLSAHFSSVRSPLLASILLAPKYKFSISQVTASHSPLSLLNLTSCTYTHTLLCIYLSVHCLSLRMAEIGFISRRLWRTVSIRRVPAVAATTAGNIAPAPGRIFGSRIGFSQSRISVGS